jgi:hypothetical protein
MDIQDNYPTCEICKGELHYGELCHVAEGKNYHSTCFVKDAETRLLQMKARLEEQDAALLRVATILCETRKHAGKRPCKFCVDMNIPRSAQREESSK